MTVRMHPSVVVTATENGMVLLDQRAGWYFELNPAGASIVHALTEGADPVREVVGQSAVPAQQAAGDVKAFLEALLGRGLAVPR
ncbi:lasso peptide biosynthesis PqqD family chaperone [Amycolatopsis sp. CA-128772]|uniref:lasso peptide biosynthesis PqqD family chaperone n=1 Tax=Amycolatopsis sp. CA-128772 TaxID=2073159 RepID=UPI000CD16A9C|nr:lasso peptide biosynthesis PqqD family chaperone [Amycolatopsis sp. CA-128772]